MVPCHTLELSEPPRVVSSFVQGIRHFTRHCTGPSRLQHPARWYFVVSTEDRGYFRQPPPPPRALGLAARPGQTAPRVDVGVQTAQGSQTAVSARPGWQPQVAPRALLGLCCCPGRTRPVLPAAGSSTLAPHHTRLVPGPNALLKGGGRWRAPPLVCQRAELGDGEGGGRRQGWSPRRGRGGGSAGGGHCTA